jgi:ADP-ribose pyrophosphatase YjhB (NUDIX family)
VPHIHEKIDFTVDVFIVHDNKILLRKHDKYDKWLAVGGHIELDEDPNQAALREVKEEVGLTVELVGSNNDYVASKAQGGSYKDLLAPVYLNRHHTNETHEHISFVYFARAVTIDIQAEAGEPICETHWFTKSELLEPGYKLADDICYYAQQALDRLT